MKSTEDDRQLTRLENQIVARLVKGASPKVQSILLVKGYSDPDACCFLRNVVVFVLSPPRIAAWDNNEQRRQLWNAFGYPFRQPVHDAVVVACVQTLVKLARGRTQLFIVGLCPGHFQLGGRSLVGL